MSVCTTSFLLPISARRKHWTRLFWWRTTCVHINIGYGRFFFFFIIHIYYMYFLIVLYAGTIHMNAEWTVNISTSSIRWEQQQQKQEAICKSLYLMLFVRRFKTSYCQLANWLFSSTLSFNMTASGVLLKLCVVGLFVGESNLVDMLNCKLAQSLLERGLLLMHQLCWQCVKVSMWQKKKKNTISALFVIETGTKS